jgi:hypothetical protein
MEKLTLQEITKNLELVSQKVENTFGGLSVQQLNWKPTPEKWSVGQCIKHIILSNELYFNMLDSIANGTKMSNFWEKMPLLPQMFGNLLIKSIHPKNLTKTKTISKVNPIQSNIEADIISLFRQHQNRLIEKLLASQTVNAQSTIITSPFAGFVVYSLFDLYNILWIHEERHFLQAKRVMEEASFPKK